jgi:Gelsolin repeat
MLTYINSVTYNAIHTACTIQVRNREEYIIYMWQGRDSTADEKGSSALLAKDLDDSLNGSPVQVSVHT